MSWPGTRVSLGNGIVNPLNFYMYWGVVARAMPKSDLGTVNSAASLVYCPNGQLQKYHRNASSYAVRHVITVNAMNQKSGFADARLFAQSLA